jgi:hypothetical protein
MKVSVGDGAKNAIAAEPLQNPGADVKKSSRGASVSRRRRRCNAGAKTTVASDQVFHIGDDPDFYFVRSFVRDIRRCNQDHWR